jgi:putative ABC transport system permease protein
MFKNPIFDIENWREIGQTLSRNKTRTFLTAFGIFWGTAMLAMLIGGASGLKGLMSRNFNGFSTNLSAMIPSRTTISYKGFNKGMTWSLNSTDIDNIRRTAPYIEYASPITSIYATAKYKTNSSTGATMGVESDYFKIITPKIYAGRILDANDVKQMHKVAVVGKRRAEELFGSDYRSAIGEYINDNGIYFKVVGIAGQTAEAQIGGKIDDAIILPATVQKQAFNIGDNYGYFIYTAPSGHKPKENFKYITRAICANHPISPDDSSAIYQMDISEQFEQVENVFLGIQLLAIFVGLGTLFAGIIGVGNIMWIIVKERTHEIGIRRALGAKPSDIIVQILSESMVLTTIAGMFGIAFAILVLAVAEQLLTDPIKGSAGFNLLPQQAIAIFITFIILGTAAGIIPAVKAMKIKPIEAINDK